MRITPANRLAVRVLHQNDGVRPLLERQTGPRQQAYDFFALARRHLRYHPRVESKQKFPSFIPISRGKTVGSAQTPQGDKPQVLAFVRDLT